jgi:SAM-dependent methyltransferase
MPSPVEPLFVGMLPRAPFLAHSDELLQHLLSLAPADCHTALEIGCGPCSPLLPILRRRWPRIDLHQIDARPDVVAEAAKHHPGGRVEQMLASDMAAISAGSKQLVVAMSVFDQNADDMLPAIAQEIHRVLAPEGLVVYIHNEEMNLPSAADSFLQRSSGQTLLLPSDRWLPGSDVEYCSADRNEVEHALYNLGESARPLLQYLVDLYPSLYGTPPDRSEYWKVAAPVMRNYTLPVMCQIRESVTALREQQRVRLDDYRTKQLLQQHIEGRIFCESLGFKIERSGFFELRQKMNWKSYFAQRPAASHFVRGTMRFGYATASTPPPNEEYAQDLNGNPPVGDEDVMFIAFQYGLVARRV